MIKSDVDKFLYVPPRYLRYHLSHNFEIRGLLVIAVRDDEGNSRPTCKSAGLCDFTDRPGFPESIYIENNARSVHDTKIFTEVFNLRDFGTTYVLKSPKLKSTQIPS